MTQDISRSTTRILLVISALVFGVLMILLPLQGDAISFNPKDNLSGTTKELVQGDLSDLDIGQERADVIAINLINVALTLLGTLCVVLLIYGGFIWLWARGNQEEVQRAKDIIQGTIIGLIIVLASYGIVRYVFGTVADITGASYVDSSAESDD